GSLRSALAHPPGRGFAIFPADGSPTITLQYPDRSRALTCDHAALIGALRDAAMGHPGVTYVPFAHVVRLDGERLTFEHDGHAGGTTVAVGRVVGADGRSSVTRKWLRLPDDRVTVSSTAGLLLEDAELPHEGLGHLM